MRDGACREKPESIPRAACTAGLHPAGVWANPLDEQDRVLAGKAFRHLDAARQGRVVAAGDRIAAGAPEAGVVTPALTVAATAASFSSRSFVSKVFPQRFSVAVEIFLWQGSFNTQTIPSP